LKLSREYKPLKIPDDMQKSLIFNNCKGNQLDIFGVCKGIERKSFSFIKEPDSLFKIRLTNFGIIKKIKEEDEYKTAQIHLKKLFAELKEQNELVYRSIIRSS
jgi:hypothetical protein